MNHNMIIQFKNDISTERVFHKYKSFPPKHTTKQKNITVYSYVLLSIIVFVIIIISNIKSNEIKQLTKHNTELNNILTSVNNNQMMNEHNYNDKVKEIEKMDLRIQMKEYLIEQMKKKSNTGRQRRSIDILELKNKIRELNEIFQQEKLKEKDYLIKIRDINTIIETRHLRCNQLREQIMRKRSQLGLN